MTFEIRPITNEDYAEFMRVEAVGFGGSVSPEDLEVRRAGFEVERSIAAFEGRRMLGTASALSLELTLPGGGMLAAPGVSWVSVLPVERRRGILTGMMRRLLDDYVARGEPLAMLTASESTIYGRFGFGVATSAIRWEIERAHGAFARVWERSGRVELVEHAQAIPAFVAFYDRWRGTQPGAVSRHEAHWTQLLANPTTPVDGSGPRYYLLYRNGHDAVEGIAHYRLTNKWDDGVPSGVLEVRDVFTLTVEATAALWRYCLDLDLVRTVRAGQRPVDEPLRWMLADSRRLRTTRLRDDLWLRLLDVPVALAARRYAMSGRVVFEVRDAFRPETAGRYALEGSPEGAECRRTQEQADLALDVADLSAAYLGGVRFATLAQAGRVAELTPGAGRRADALFVSDPPAWCGTPF